MSSASALKTVLIIDDDEPNRLLLQDLLEMEGYRILTAPDGPSALRILKGARPSVILLDMKMPYMDGAQVLSALKADEEVASIPVVVVSAYRGAPAAGSAAAFICKPFEIDHLLEAVARCSSPA